MLVENRGTLAHRCGALWSLSAGVSAAVVVLIAAGLRLEASAAPDKKPKASSPRTAWKRPTSTS